MKKGIKSKLLFSLLVDFLIFTFIFFTIGTVIYFGRSILFAGAGEPSEIRVTSKDIENVFLGEVTPGDELFDTLTKRRLGVIKEIRTIDTAEDKHVIEFSIDASFYPRSKSLRTKNLWFEIERIEHAKKS